jgi:hypothetical protein
MTVKPEGLGERLLLAVEGTQGFLGLERPDGLLQFCPSDPAPGPKRFQVGGQTTDIEAKYLVDLSTAAAIIDEWLTLGEMSSAGSWERH